MKNNMSCQKNGTKFSRKYGLTQEELSKQLKVSAGAISLWEKKSKNIFEEVKRKEISETLNKIPYLKKLQHNLRQRCNYSKDKKYKYYGGKGIKMLLKTKDIMFLWKRDKGYLLKEPSIDRKDNVKDYTIGNCRFIEMEKNRANRQNGTWHKFMMGNMTIKEFRKKYKLSREDLASKVGVSWMTIFRYENKLIKKPNRVIKEKLDRVMRGYNVK